MERELEGNKIRAEDAIVRTYGKDNPEAKARLEMLNNTFIPLDIASYRVTENSKEQLRKEIAENFTSVAKYQEILVIEKEYDF